MCFSVLCVCLRPALQFLTFQDYLLRSFTLFRLESAYEVREDVADAVHRLKPKQIVDYDTGSRVEKTEFQGWARMVAEVRCGSWWGQSVGHTFIVLAIWLLTSLPCLVLLHPLIPLAAAAAAAALPSGLRVPSGLCCEAQAGV